MATYTASATTGTTCACCGTLSGATLQCRTRGGLAVLCGFSEYTDISSPPKKYRVKTLSGVFVGDSYTDTSCLNFNCQSTDTYSGTCSYDSVTCALNESGLRTRTGSCPNENAATCSIGVFLSGGDTEVLTATTRSATSSLTCVNFLGTGFRRPSQPTALEVISDEDTNADAIARLLAGAGGTWSAWLVPGGGACGGSPPSCCIAAWEERVSDFDFQYTESQFRVIASGLTPSTTYNARVDIQRKPYGSGSYALFQTLIISGTTDGAGNFQEDGDVPNEEGFESYPSAAYIVIPS